MPIQVTAAMLGEDLTLATRDQHLTIELQADQAKHVIRWLQDPTRSIRVPGVTYLPPITVAQDLQVAQSTIRRWCTEGRVRFKWAGKGRLVHLEGARLVKKNLHDPATPRLRRRRHGRS